MGSTRGGVTAASGCGRACAEHHRPAARCAPAMRWGASRRLPQKFTLGGPGVVWWRHNRPFGLKRFCPAQVSISRPSTVKCLWDNRRSRFFLKTVTFPTEAPRSRPTHQRNSRLYCSLRQELLTPEAVEHRQQPSLQEGPQDREVAIL